MKVLWGAGRARKLNTALYLLSASTSLLSGCMSNPVSGYFARMPDLATLPLQTGNSNPALPGKPGSGLPATLPPTPAPPEVPPPFAPNGILNGHFDVDTATGDMPFPIGKGNVTYHVHQYDKSNKTTTVDFFNLINKTGKQIGNIRLGTQFDQIQNTLPSSQRFYLIVVNAGLNPGGVLEINGEAIRVTNYQNLSKLLMSNKVPPPAYTIGAPQTPGDKQLQSLKLAFDSNVPAKDLLVPTSPDNCVFPNITGANGEYRDGALVIQAIDAKSLQLDPNTGAAISNGGMIWEGIVYNHYMLVDTDGSETDPHLCY
jgi:hypothetical protein